MDFHEELSRLGEKEGLKGRKLGKSVESFTWNITVLKVSQTKMVDSRRNVGRAPPENISCVPQGQSDLLRGAKMESLDALRQLALACEACGLTSSSSNINSSSSAEIHYSSHPQSGRRSSTHSNGRI